MATALTERTKECCENRGANELGAAFRTPVCARFARVSFVLKTL